MARWPSPGLLPHPELGMGPLLGPRFGRDGPLWEVWEPDFEPWAPGTGSFFVGLGPFSGSKKNMES